MKLYDNENTNFDSDYSDGGYILRIVRESREHDSIEYEFNGAIVYNDIDKYTIQFGLML